MLSINQVLQEGRYRIVAQSGQTDTGLTYQAFDNLLNTKVIIKETVFDASAQPSVARQLESLATIQHESFMQVHGYFSEVDRQFLVTESVEGENLKELLEKKKRPFLLFDVLNWTGQLLDALIYLHSKKPPLIHRGITPHNLTLTKNNQVKLLNSAFNLTADEWQNKSFSSLRLPYASLELLWDTLDPTSQKVILNSYDEKSAEIVESPIDERSDVYALGATVYYLVTGMVPVDALERSIDLLENKEDPLTNPSKINPQIPRNFSHFLMKSLELKRENRFESASAMRTALQPMLELMRKVERETQTALQDPRVREAALREVEIARENLRKQREEENLHKSQDATKAVEPTKISHAPISQGAFLEEIEKAKQNLQQKNEREQLQRVQSETQKVEVTEFESNPLPAQTVEAENVEPMTENSVLVASAPVESSFSANETEVEPAQTLIDDTDSLELFADVQPKGGKSRLIVAIAVVVILAVGGFFGYRFFNSQNQAAIKQNAVSNPETPKTENPAPVASETPAPVQTAPSVASPTPTVETQAVQPTPAVLPTEDRSKAKKVTTPTPPPVDKKPTPAAKTPAPKKKELTVDDLIN